ncbi:hypothetical protein X975_26769, partial [Stegodyphus mimosarum]
MMMNHLKWVPLEDEVSETETFGFLIQYFLPPLCLHVVMVAHSACIHEVQVQVLGRALLIFHVSCFKITY